jgi:hypothetical protein
VDVHYIDSKSIPANGLGGVISNWLHVQHTDTGTTALTFILNNSSATGYVALSSVGQTTGKTFTFPTSASQALVGATDLASTASGKGASTIGIQDSAGHFSSTNVETALAELATDVASVSAYTGYKRGFKLGYSSGTALTITGGMWDHSGTTQQNVYTSSQLSFTCGSAGSNSDSDNLGASELHYIYIDDSAVVTSGSALLTATEFINTTTAPAWSNSKVGWYNGNDRCIGAILTEAASTIAEFQISSSRLQTYVDATSIVAFASAAAPTTGTSLDLSAIMPVFSTRARLILTTATAGTSYSLGSFTGHNYDTIITISHNDGYTSFDTTTSSVQEINWLASAGATTAILLSGFYIDDL